MVAAAAVGEAAGKGAELLLQYLQSQQQQQNYEKSIMEAKRQQEAATKLAQEGRGDVFGNRLVYKPGLGWTYQLTPQTSELVGGQQNAALRSQELARQGAGDYETARNKYLYGPHETQAGITDELTRLLMLNRQKGLREGVNVFARQALRMKMGNQIPRLIQEADKQYGQSLEEMILKGRQAGREEYQKDEGFRTSQGGNDLTRFFNQATQSPTGAPTAGLTSQADDAARALNAALTGTNSALNSAYRSAAALGQPNYDLSGFGAAIGKLYDQYGQPTESTYPKTQARLMPSGGAY